MHKKSYLHVLMILSRMSTEMDISASMSAAPMMARKSSRTSCPLALGAQANVLS